MKLLKIIKKNFKVLFRSKFASFIVIFGPLLVILLIGFAFDNFNSYSINVGVFSQEYSDLSTQYIVEMSDSPNFQIIKYVSEDECIEEIKYGFIHTCLIFPNNFTLEKQNNSLDFYVDPSNINLVWMVIDEVSKKIESRSSKVSLNLTQDLMSRIIFSQNKSNEILNLAINFEEEIKETNNLIEESKEKSSDLSFEVNEVSTSSLSVSKTSSELNSLYSKALSAVKETSDLINDIKDSTTWNQLNSTQESELNSLLDSATSSSESIESQLSSDKNDTDKELTSLQNSIDNLGEDLVDIQNLLSSVEETKDVVLTNLDNLILKLVDFSENVEKTKSLSQNIISSLSSIQITDAKNIVSPISTNIIPVTNTDEEHVNYLFPALLILIIMFISLLLSSLNIVMEKNSRAYFRNFVTPTSDGTFLIGAILTNFIILALELGLVLLVTFVAFDSSIFTNIQTTLLILFMTCSFFIFLGMIIGYLFSSEEGAILGTISISSIFFFISNLVMPLDALPAAIKFFVNLNPFIITTNMLKRSLLFEVTMFEMLDNLIFFSYYVLGAVIFLFIIQRITKLKFIYHNNMKHKKVTENTKVEEELESKNNKKNKEEKSKKDKNKKK